MDKQLDELKGFIKELKDDRQATKEKEKRESWTKYVSLSVVIIAVIAAVATQWSGKYGGQVSMCQAKASDTWAYYQAKSIKQHLDDATVTQLEAQPVKTPAVEAQIIKMKATIKRYDQEKADLQAKAEALELQGKIAGLHGGKMSSAVSMFTVAIAIASICMVTKKKPLWYVSMIMAAIAICKMILAWTT